MNQIVVERRVGRDGVLQLMLSLGAEGAGRDVQVTIEIVGPKREMTSDAWQAGVVSTVGGWQGEFGDPSITCCRSESRFHEPMMHGPDQNERHVV